MKVLTRAKRRYGRRRQSGEAREAEGFRPVPEGTRMSMPAVEEFGRWCNANGTRQTLMPMA